LAGVERMKRFIPNQRMVAGTLPFIGCVAYLSYAGLTWIRYGHPRMAKARESPDTSSGTNLDRFIPTGEVEERHKSVVLAPASVAFRAMSHLIISESRVIRAIFRLREFLLGAKANNVVTLGLVDQARRWGWGILMEEQGREIIFGAVTQPWLAKPVFRALDPSAYSSFKEPGYAKIAWTIRVDPIDEKSSIIRTETRVVTTDSEARAKFRLYWAAFSPGIILIRRILLLQAKAAAERQRRELVQYRHLVNS
jgi:hypothetical protein